MNAIAQKKARQAELEFELLTVWKDRSFVAVGNWLQYMADRPGYDYHAQAKELISLYEEGTK